MIDAARWLSSSTALPVRLVIQRALADVGICEIPPGSNRSGVIDGYNDLAGVAHGSYWCASALGAWYRDAGLRVPSGYASCDNWLRWGKVEGTWVTTPQLGAAVLYGVGEDAQHIGIVVRIDPLVLTVEGNTSIGGQFSRNGVAVDLKEVNRARLLGYIIPTWGAQSV